MKHVELFFFTRFLLWQFSTARHIFLEDVLPNITIAEIFNSKSAGDRNSVANVCSTETCKVAAQNILESLDVNTDPCEDFYTYSCGKWIGNHPVPPTENHWNQFDILDKKLDLQINELLNEENKADESDIVKAAKTIYNACMNTERIEEKGLKPLLDLLEELNNWPMVTPHWDEERFDWQKLVVDVRKKLAINALFLIYVDADRKNTSRNLLIIDEPSLELPKYMLVHSSEVTFMESYATFVIKAAALVSEAKGNKIFLLSLLLQSLKLITFEIELAKIMKDEESKRNAEDLYHLVSIKELQQWTNERTMVHANSRINWKSVIGSLVEGSGGVASDDTPIVVTDWNFLEKLMRLIDVTPPRVLANYILWRVVSEMSRDLNKDMLKLNFQFKSKLSSVEEDIPRWRDCVLTAGHLSFVVGYMYVKKHFSEEAKAKAVEMVEDIRAAIKEELAEVPWMDEQTKKQAIQKADTMNHFIGYPEWFDNITALENHYKGVTVGEDHFQNKLNLRQFSVRKLMDNLNEDVDRNEWMASPAVANAFYNPHLNSIIFPAGVLQDPFFNKDQPHALNYGSIGAVVGHEITHGFDDTGRQSDKFGNIKQWWSKDTEKTYVENALCFINQYRNYRVPELDDLLNMKVTMNGLLTLDENIADNGGLRAALRAYKSHRNRSRNEDSLLPGLEHFTPEQLFYIGFARVWCESHTTASLLGDLLGDTHAPNKLRVIGSLSNSEHFAKTWQCKLGSNMNPENKCTLW